MRIGIDIDGVILDYMNTVRAHAELYDYKDLKKKGVINKSGFKVKQRYDWTPEELKYFSDNYFVRLTKEAPFYPLSKEILKMLKDEGHELIIISARGKIHEEAITAAKEMFEKENLFFDDYFWKTEEKLEIYKRENIDIIIDDSADNCEDASNNNIYTLYFKTKGQRDLEESKYLREVENWGEIYRYVNYIKDGIES